MADVFFICFSVAVAVAASRPVHYFDYYFGRFAVIESYDKTQ